MRENRETYSQFVPDWLAKRAALTPNKVALIDIESGQSRTYKEWQEAANQTAHFLASLGLKQGDRLAVLAPNSLAYLDVWFACNKLGAILQALNWRLTAPELSYLIDDATPKLFIYSATFAQTVNDLRREADLHQPEHWITVDESLHLDDISISTASSFSITSPPPIELDPNDPWVICYTGGTTGLPKGALLTYKSISTNAINTVMSWGLTPEDVAILNAPLFHTGGLNVFTAPLVQIGGTSLLCTGFEAEQTLKLIRNANVTLFFGVPTMFTMLQQHPDWAKTDFSGLKLVISGGAPCPLEIFEKFWARGVNFKTGYGLTEAGPNTFWLPDEDVQRKPGAVGVPLFHVDVKVVDEQGNICSQGEVGQLLIRGDHVCGGYWNNPQATAAAIVDGWLYTGDLAYCDADGYYSIVGRVKDMIISGGENIYPAEIESLIYGHPDVAEVAVIGLPHKTWGEVGCAVVVATNPALTAEDLESKCRQSLAGYKVPKSFVFVNELPKTGPGKIDKKLLQQNIVAKSKLM